MMRTLSALTVCLLLPLISHGAEEANEAIYDEVPLDGLAPYNYSVGEIQLHESSDWSPTSDKAIPLTPRKAVSIANRVLEKHVDELKDYRLTSIDLKSDWCTNKGGEGATRWYWVVSYENFTVNIGGVPLLTNIVVLLNGSSPELIEMKGEDANVAWENYKREHMAVAEIRYQDLGKRYQIKGDFGKLYKEFNIRGKVLAPTGKGDKEGKLRVEITHINGEEWPEGMIKTVITDKTFEVGSEVAFVVREEGKLEDPDGIDQILANQKNPRIHCATSLHLRKDLGKSGVSK